MNTSLYTARMEKTRALMQAQDVDVFFVSPSANLRYLTGYAVRPDERLFLLALPAAGAPFALVNALYKDQAAVMPVPDIITWADGEDPLPVLTAEIARRALPVRRAALEPALPALLTVPLGRALAGTEFVLGSPLTNPLRQYKDAAELDVIRRASALADEALEELMSRGDYWLGKTERDFSGELGYHLRRAGFERAASIVAVGANAALPHHVSGDTVIERGRGLLVDFWGCLEGYFTDCSRTFFFGRPDAEFEKVHRIVLEAHLAAEARARPGYRLGDVDAAAREVIEGYGYGPYFTHRTGHGIGLEEHEGASAAPGDMTPVEPGMVFSIEPGIYLPGRLGVRIENLVAAGPNAPEVLHHYPRELPDWYAGKPAPPLPPY
jgi:Xaa-Pro dipeptidase